jgi:hypothetical protein
MVTIARDSQAVNSTVTRLMPVAQIEFRWPGYDPARALADYEPTRYERIVFTEHLGAVPRVTGVTLGDVKAWMDEHDLVLFGQPTGKHDYAGGRWCGRYTLTIGRELAPEERAPVADNSSRAARVGGKPSQWQEVAR